MADEILLHIPASASYVRLARMAVTDAASRAGLDVDEIDDLRVAVSELCGLLVNEEGTTSVELRVSPGRVEVSGRGAAPADGEATRFAEALVAAVTDECALEREGDAGTFRVVKTAGAPSPREPSGTR